jgi:hypothetical protein
MICMLDTQSAVALYKKTAVAPINVRRFVLTHLTGFLFRFCTYSSHLAIKSPPTYGYKIINFMTFSNVFFVNAVINYSIAYAKKINAVVKKMASLLVNVGLVMTCMIFP